MIKLNVVTPEGEILACDDAKAVFLPGRKGRFEVLQNHAPLVSSLTAGEVRCVTGNGQTMSVKVESGFVEVLDNVVSVCAEI